MHNAKKNHLSSFIHNLIPDNLTCMRKPGYILIFSLLMLATLMAIATYIMTRGSTYLPFARTIHDREKAITIARSGIEVALAQLSQVPEQPATQSHATAPSSQQPSSQQISSQQISSQISKPPTTSASKTNKDQLFLIHFLPIINRWQAYTLTEEIEGVDAQLRICLMCEEGKINLNAIYDYTRKQFYGKNQSDNQTDNQSDNQTNNQAYNKKARDNKNWDAFMQELCKKIENIMGGKHLYNALTAFLKKREYKLIDVTELLHIQEFAIFRDHQFYHPPEQQTGTQNTLYLTDIFTVNSGKKTINPWVFSNSLSVLLGLPEARYGDTPERIAKMPELLKNFKAPTSWQQDWSTLLLPLYQKDLSHLPKNSVSLFDTSTHPRLFSVISEAQVGTVTQRLYALLERTQHTHHDKTLYKVTVKKMYWL